VLVVQKRWFVVVEDQQRSKGEMRKE